MTDQEIRAKVLASTGLGLSTHALDRFRSRFPEGDFSREVASAISHPKKLTKKRMNILKRDCPAHAGKMADTRYLINHNGAVFVVYDKTVVTVFQLDSKRT
jgi:hypothetical protein